jgi:ParB family chromosome partitioning protein
MQTPEVKLVAMSDLIPDPNQPRQEFFKEDLDILKSSIEQKGIMSPIVVEVMKDGYLIIDGERRYRCAKELGLTKVPVNIINAKMTPTERNIMRFQLQENHRGWGVLEKAQAVKDLKTSLGCSITELATALSLSQGYLSKLMYILEFGSGVRKKLTKIKMPFSYLDGLSRLNRAMTPELIKEFPDYLDTAIEKYETGVVNNNHDYYKIASMIKNGANDGAKKFFKDKKASPNQIQLEIGYTSSNTLTQVIKTAKNLTKSLSVLKKKRFSEQDEEVLQALADKINELI